MACQPAFSVFVADGFNHAVDALLIDQLDKLVAVDGYDADAVDADVVELILRTGLVELVGNFVFFADGVRISE